MDPIAHISIGLMAKSVAPKAPVWALVAATQVPDLLFFVFQAAGVEHQAITQTSLSQGITYQTLGLIAWSHGLFMGLVWSVVVAGIAWLFSRHARTSAVIGLMVLGHCLLDWIVYPNVPLFLDGSPFVGLGLATSGPGFIAGTILEIALVVTALVAAYRLWKK